MKLVGLNICRKKQQQQRGMKCKVVVLGETISAECRLMRHYRKETRKIVVMLDRGALIMLLIVLVIETLPVSQIAFV